MPEHATIRRLERRRTPDRRRAQRLERTDLGRVKSMIRAWRAVDLEERDRLERRVDELQLEVDRLNELHGLEPLPPIDAA